MANEETLAEATPNEELESESKDSTKGLSIAFKLIIAGLGGLASHGFLAYYLATSFVIPEYYSASSESTAVIEEVVVKPVQVASTVTSSQGTDDNDPEITNRAEYFSLRHIVVNPYGTNGRRFLAMDMKVFVKQDIRAGRSKRNILHEICTSIIRRK